MNSLIKDQIKKSFFAEKLKNKNGLFNSIWIYPFKTQSGAIISIHPLWFIQCQNELDLDSAIDFIDYKILTNGVDYELWHIEIKINNNVKYFESDSTDDILNLFKNYGGVDVVGTMRLAEICKEIYKKEREKRNEQTDIWKLSRMECKR